MGRHTWLGSLGWRLLAAFLVVAVSAVALLAVIAAVSVDRHSATLADQQRSQLRDEIGQALAAAYTAGRGTWQPRDLAGLQALATAEGMHIVITDQHGREVAHVGVTDGSPTETHDAPDTTLHPTPAPTSHDNREHLPGTTSHQSSGRQGSGSGHHDAIAPLPTVQPAALTSTPIQGTSTNPGAQPTVIPIVVDGRQVGSARFVLPAVTPSPVSAARAALLRQLAWGAGLAVLLAAVAALFVARRVSRPLLALTVATRAFAAGDPQPEALLRPAPGELGEVGKAFTEMAATVQRQDELRRAVIADVAHELRTPVTILRGQTEQLLDGIAEPTPDRIVSLHDEVLRLGRLTDDLATLSAADAAGLALHAAPVDLGALAEQTVEAMRAHFDDADLKISADTVAGVIVRGDSERLAQVLTNLLTNAAKFTPAGGRVTVTVEPVGPDAVLAVTDTGPGIPADELPHVFERFWRGRAAGQRAGSGIGLAVVHALVTAHGGRVTASSPAEGGTRFTMRIPLAAAHRA